MQPVMQTLRLTPDQWTAVGQGMTFAVTDIDSSGVRVLLRGRVIGGPDDGAPLDRAVEIAVGGEARVGIVVITVIDTKHTPAGDTVKVGVFCPQHVAIRLVKEPT